MVFTSIPNHLSMVTKQRTTTLTNVKMIARSRVIFLASTQTNDRLVIPGSSGDWLMSSYIESFSSSHETHQGEMLRDLF